MARLPTELRCARCGAPFQRRSRFQNRKTYCTPRCRRAASHARHKEWRLAYDLRWRDRNRERYLANRKRLWALHRESNSKRRREHAIAKMLRDVPDDPFVREIMTGLFVARGDAIRRGIISRTRAETQFSEAHTP